MNNTQIFLILLVIPTLLLPTDLNIKISLIVIIIVIFLLTLTSSSTNIINSCNSYESLYDNKKAQLSNIDTNDNYLKNSLGDFYVKSAFNCCATEDFKYGYVDLCALTVCLKRGVRFLDFAIYSINNQPVVATSSIDSIYAIESLNYLSFAKVIQLINSRAFSSMYCPNPSDPLIINLRMFTKNENIFNAVAKILSSELSSRLLDRKYSYEYRNESNQVRSISSVNIKELINKAIIFIKDENQLLGNTKLTELCNLSCGSSNSACKSLTENEIKEYTGMTRLIDFNKYGITIARPNNNTTPANLDSDIMEQGAGVQFCAMCFQNKDSFLKQYEDKFFNSPNGSFAFRPRPCNQRSVPIYIDLSDVKCERSNQPIEIVPPFCDPNTGGDPALCEDKDGKSMFTLE